MLEQQDLLSGLNDRQQEAVTTTQGPVLILAGPGSGKTRVITHRIAYLTQQEDVFPWHILAVTFTNKAAKEMRERLEKLVGPSQAKDMHIGTFHAICARVLRNEADYLAPLGLSRSFAILDMDDQVALVKQGLKELNRDDKQYRPQVIHGLISRAKNEMFTPEQMAENAKKPTEEVAARVYKLYQQYLQQNNSVDFDDLLMITERLWRREAEVLERYQKRWRYLHVDEFQDCNLPQYKLVRLLAYGTPMHPTGHSNICVVGDDDQMIYSWRGASSENVIRFERDFPQRKLIILDQNYRSTQTILDAAQHVVRQNRLRKDKQLWTEKGSGELINVHTAFNEELEAYYIVDEIARLLREQRTRKYKLNDIAVMYRTNAQTRALEEQFMRNNLPYKIIGSRKFYERKEIRDTLAYLRLVANPHDNLSLQRIVNVPNRKIGAKTMSDLQTWATQQGLTLFDAIQQVSKHPTLRAAAKTSLASFGIMVERFHAAIHELSLPGLLDHIIEQSGYGPELRTTDEQDLERWANVQELRRMAEDYEEIETSAALELFLENVALVGGADTTQNSENGAVIPDEHREAVTLITLHAAKGLEYPIVFIVGMDEGSLPHSRTIGKPEEIEEERRLAYVGFTRAMERLYLVRARRRSFFGDTQHTEPSRFLDDIPKRLLTSKQQVQEMKPAYTPASPLLRRTNAAPPVIRRKAESSTPEWGQNNPPRVTTQRFKAGEQVQHAIFGTGLILKSTFENGDEHVEVQFGGKIGKKSLAVEFARLEKL